MNKQIIYLFLLIFILCGCSSNRMSEHYVFQNKDEAIESVELLLNPYTDDGYSEHEGEFISIRTLEKNEISSFMESVYALETGKCISPPPTNHGFYIVRVTYENGDIEMLGSYHLEFVKKGEAPKGIGAYYFTSQTAFETLFYEYAKTGDGSLS